MTKNDHNIVNNIMNDIVNDKKCHNTVTDSFAHKPDGLLILYHTEVIETYFQIPCERCGKALINNTTISSSNIMSFTYFRFE